MKKEIANLPSDANFGIKLDQLLTELSRDEWPDAIFALTLDLATGVATKLEHEDASANVVA